MLILKMNFIFLDSSIPDMLKNKRSDHHMKNLKKNHINNPHVSGKKERLRAFIKKMGFKATRQRDLIATEFLKTAGHITAEDLYKKITRRYKDIGFTTVYRTLKLLSKSGLATERVFADNLTRYEPLSAEDHHDHLICLSCGS
ncbi:MAG: transcriptional repressor, partial [Nitrospirae bacterium]|nr:transcriptional repressor [Nitrospirota bacterium]